MARGKAANPTWEPGKHPGGPPKKIPSPQYLYELFTRYKQTVKNTPRKVHDFVGKDAVEVFREKEVPLTYEGFQNFVEDLGVITTLDHYFINWEGRYEEFVGVCTRIKREIRQDQIEGGLVGIYNPSITQRLNGLVDKTDITTKGEKITSIDYSKLSDGALEEIAKAGTGESES